MPRGRGGARQGTPGTAYGNRTDLNSPSLPVMTATNQEYGKATQQANAQRAMPMGGTQTPPAPAAPAAALPRPGSMPYSEPTMRPNEPVTTGIDYGPGAGSEALGPAPQALPSIQQLTMGGSSPLMNQLATFAARMGI